MGNLYRNAVASPSAQSFWTKVKEPDELSGLFVAGIVMDPKNKEHSAFLKQLTEIENDMRKEAGKPEVKQTTALKEKNYDGKKIKVLKATTKKTDFVCANIDGSTLKHNPWSTDEIKIVVLPSFNDGSVNVNHMGLKLYLNGIRITKSEGDYGDAGDKKSSSEQAADLLGVELPEEITPAAPVDAGDDDEDLIF